jgi:hypothetical protein
VNRKAETRFITPDKLMLRHLARTAEATLEPTTQPMRYALPGERPPSTRPPGARDDIIDRFDAYTHRMKRERIN